MKRYLFCVRDSSSDNGFADILVEASSRKYAEKKAKRVLECSNRKDLIRGLTFEGEVPGDYYGNGILYHNVEPRG